MDTGLVVVGLAARELCWGGSSLVLGSQEAGGRTVISPRLVLRPRRRPALLVAL